MSLGNGQWFWTHANAGRSGQAGNSCSQSKLRAEPSPWDRWSPAAGQAGSKAGVKLEQQKRPQGPRNTRLASRQRHPCTAKKSPPHSGLHELGCCQEVWGGILPYWSGPLRQTWELCPAWGSPTWGRHQCIGGNTTEASEVAGATAQGIQRQAVGAGLFQSWEDFNEECIAVFREEERKQWQTLPVSA